MPSRSPKRERRQAADSLAHLERLIERMNDLGAEAENAAARIAHTLSGSLSAVPNTDQHEFVGAIGDVIEIVTERSKLAHEAHRLITELRRTDLKGWRAIPDDDPSATGDS